MFGLKPPAPHSNSTAVLGQFKRGKSTLLNALLGVPLLPTGVTPVTAIPTFIKAGTKTTARITFKGGCGSSGTRRRSG